MANHNAALSPTSGRFRLVTLLSLTGLLAACTDQAPESRAVTPADSESVELPTASMAPATPTRFGADTLVATQTLCDGAVPGFTAATGELETVVTALVNEPDDGTLDRAQNQWLATNMAWGMALPCLAAPALEASPRRHQARLARTAAGPALAGFMDAMPGYEDSGLVHDETVALSLDSLIRQHQVTDDAEVALGLYALEILLFGVNGRVSNDFATPSEADDTNSPDARRSAISELAGADLAQQGRDWEGYWRTHWTAGADTMAEPIALAHLQTRLTAWHTAVQWLANVAAAQIEGQSGRALYTAHDWALLQGLQNTLVAWWQSPAITELVVSRDLNDEDWRSTGQQLAALADRENWTAAHSALTAARDQLHQLITQLPGPPDTP